MRKIKLLSILFILVLVFCQEILSQKPEWAGVWGIWGGEKYSNSTYPWYKGTKVSSTWKQIQPGRNTFVFTNLDNQITAAVNNGLYVGFMVYISPDFAPEWLYTEAGVPKVVTTNGDTHPYYFNDTFKSEFKRMITAVADHIDTYPANVREKIVLVQAIVSKSGDPQPWNSEPVDPQYSIPNWATNIEYRDYTREIYSHYYNTYSTKNPKIIVLLKPVGNNETWCYVNLPEAGRKTYSPGQGHHLGKEDQYFFQYNSIKNGKLLGVREEFDTAIKNNTSWYQSAPIWNLYWTGLFSLTYGLDIWNHRIEFMDNNPNQHAYALNFFTDWAGYKDPEMSRGAWVAFRDDIDGADLARFPESVFGLYNNGLNPDRNNTIAQSFSAYGAKQDDPGFVVTGSMMDVVSKQKGLNDVQSRVWRGNYGMFINQLKANETSQGYWRIGATNQPFGRFARGFKHSQGKNAIYMDIDDKVFEASTSQEGKTAVNVKIVYFDDGFGKWQVNYDAVDNTNKIAEVVTNSNSGVWKTLNIILNDVKFANRGPENSDISIINADEQDNIFHMVEIIKQEASDISTLKAIHDKVVKCWPNPYSPYAGELSILYPQINDHPASIQIFNIKGQLVNELSARKILHLSGMMAWDGKNNKGEIVEDGLYFGRILEKNSVLHFRIVVLS